MRIKGVLCEQRQVIKGDFWEIVVNKRKILKIYPFIIYLRKNPTHMKDKQIIQSTTYTTIRNGWGIYAQRLLVLLAEAMQYRFEGADLRNRIVKDMPIQREWIFNLSDFKIGQTNNNTYIREQLEQVLNAKVQWIDEQNIWHATVLFTEVRHDSNESQVLIKINEDLWTLFVELSKGFKKYQLETAMKFSSSNALKLYQVLAGNKEPITYGIDYLREMLGAEDKYNLTKDFLRTINGALKEINEKAEINVSYEPKYKSIGKGRPSIDALTFFVNRKQEKASAQNAEIVRKYGLSLLPNALKVKLMESFNFTKQGIKANAQLLEEAYTRMQNPTLMELLDKRRKKAMSAKNPQGYIINAIAHQIDSLDKE